MVTLVNRAKMTTSSTGTGSPITLGSAEAGYQSFADAGVVDGNVVRYVIEDGDNWEIGTGTYTASGTTLTRTVLESSNADAALNLTGSAVVYVSAAAEDIPPALELYAENPSSPTAPSATGTNAVAIGNGAVASAFESIAIGRDSDATQANNIALGRLSQATGTNGAFAIGFSSTASGERSISIGSGTSGFSSVSAGLASVAIGNSRASGTDSFAAAIANNTSTYGATGANSVAIGDLAKATNTNAVCISNTSTASGTNSAVLGGSSGTASGSGSVALGGSSNVASGVYSTAKGYYGNTNGIRLKHATGVYPNMQGAYYVLAYATTDATPIALNTDAWTPSATNQIILPNNSAYAFHGTIVARQQASAGTACAAWKIEGLIRREGSAGTTVLVNSATTVLDNTPGWGMALTADVTNGGLAITVTGAAATNIRWVATINTSEVTY